MTSEPKSKKREPKGGLSVLLANDNDKKKGKKENSDFFDSDASNIEDKNLSNNSEEIKEEAVENVVKKEDYPTPEKEVLQKNPKTDEQITIRAPKQYLNIIDRYRLTMIIKTGNVSYSKKEAFTDILKFFEENCPVELLKLPEA